VDDWYTVLSEVFTGSLGDYDPNLGSAATLAAQDLVAVEVRRCHDTLCCSSQHSISTPPNYFPRP